MLIINGSLYLRSKEDIIAVRPDRHEITVHLVSGYWCGFASTDPTTDVKMLTEWAFARTPDEDPNEVRYFNTSSSFKE